MECTIYTHLHVDIPQYHIATRDASTVGIRHISIGCAGKEEVGGEQGVRHAREATECTGEASVGAKNMTGA